MQLMDIATLQAENQTLRQQVTLLQQALEESRRENAILRQKVDALVRQCFGQKSEQLDSNQLMLLLSGTGTVEVEVPEAKPAQSPAPVVRKQSAKESRRIRVPDNLEVVSQVIEPEEVRADPSQWKLIDQEDSRMLDYQPGKFFWNVTIRPKYVRVDEKHLPPVVAPAPVRTADHTKAAPGLLAHLLVNKYADHVPYYRLEKIFLQRHGVFIARQQMVMWTRQCVALLEGIVWCIKKQVQASGYVQVDETPVRYLDPENPGRCSKGYLWTALVPGKCMLYEWHASRAAACLDSLLGDNYSGKLQCDGYSSYPAYARDKQITLFGSWHMCDEDFSKRANRRRWLRDGY